MPKVTKIVPLHPTDRDPSVRAVLDNVKIQNEFGNLLASHSISGNDATLVYELPGGSAFAAKAPAHAGSLHSDFSKVKKLFSKRLLSPSPAQPMAARASMTTAMAAPVDANVVGVGLSEKISDGRATGVLCIKFFVQVKYPEHQIPKKHALPKFIDGLPTDVEQAGVFHRFARRPRKPPAGAGTGGSGLSAGQMPDPRQRFRPAQPGSSIGFQDPANKAVMAGTFGAVVKDSQGTIYILSNNHVLADENRLAAGAPIFQPGLLDKGNSKKDQVASLTRAIALQVGKPNKVDCAIAQVLKAKLVDPAILYIGKPVGAAPAAIDMVVHKFGRTTSYRAGRVTSIDTDVTVQYETGTYLFENQAIIVGLGGQSFSDSGDSGSLILDRQSQKAVALLFAGSNTHTIANHISDVLSALDVSLV